MFGLVSLASNALAFATKALGLFRDLGLYFAGKKAQQADDLKATEKQDAQGQQIDTDVRRMSESQLDDELRRTRSGQ